MAEETEESVKKAKKRGNGLTEAMSDLGHYFVAAGSRNAGVLTIIAVVAILISGLTAAVGGMWYVPLLIGLVAIFCITVFNGAPVVAKVVVAFVLLCFASGISYQLGLFINPSDLTSMYWFLSYWIFALFCIGISYISVRANSRWGALIGSTCVAWFVSYMVGFAFLSSTAGALSVFVMGTLVFFLMYMFSRNALINEKKLPSNIMTDSMVENLLEQADQNEWDIRAISGKNDTGHFLAWKDRGYVLLPVYMEQAFTSVVTRRGKYNGYGYKGTPIGPWLSQKSFSLSPVWKSRGADMMLVLLDIKNNIDKPMVINVSLPDSHNLIPVGVIPAGSLLGQKGTVIDKLDKNFAKFFAKDLKDRQKQALAGIGRISESAVPVATKED